MANIELDGPNKTIKVDSGDLTLDIPGDIILDADGADVSFRDAGTGHLSISNSSNDAVITSLQTDKDMIFKGVDGGSLITALTLDMSDAGAATLNNGLTLTDGNLVVASGHGIDFSASSDGTTMSSELLDDYEEGTFDFGFEDGSGNAVTMNSTYKKGLYRKIGSMVHINGYADVSSLGSASGNMKLTGLPFTVLNDAAGFSAPALYPEGLSITAGHTVVGYTGINTTNVILGVTDHSSGRTHLQASELGTGNLIINLTYATA